MENNNDNSKLEYYDGNRLLSQLDLNGNRPEIFLCTTNRSAGKTTYFSRLMLNSFLKGKGKFCLIYRFNYELDSIADKFFKDIHELFFPDYYMTDSRKAKGVYHELYISKNPDEKGDNCGYAISLNNADQLKKYSHLFSDVNRMFMDEFQSENNHYCTKEIEKFISVHISFARYLPVYMCGNAVTILNPYFTALGISERLQSNTRFLRGDGFVLEHGYVEAASQAQTESLFNRAFANHQYIAYSSQNVYLNDNKTFIEKVSGKNSYMATLRYQSESFAIREFMEQGIIYCDDRPDLTNPNKLAITTDDMNVNYVMIKRNQFFIDTLRYYFDVGAFRFKNVKCKRVIMDLLSY